MSNIYNFFPLSIYRAKIKLTEKNKEEMVEEIKKMKKDSDKGQKPKQNAWTGDTHGHEYLYKNEKFKLFYEEVEKHVINYMNHFDLDVNKLKFYFQRSWATLSNSQEHISAHDHSQSNLSFAYYLKKQPGDSHFILIDKLNFPGDWILADNDFQLALIAPVDLQGEGIEGLGLSNQKYGSAFKLWAVNNKEGLNLNEADIEVEQFINAFGNELDREFISVDNTSATKRILKNSTLEWQTLFIMMVNHDKKYFVEAACPETLFKSCIKEFNNILDSVTLVSEPKS